MKQDYMNAPSNARALQIHVDAVCMSSHVHLVVRGEKGMRGRGKRGEKRGGGDFPRG